MTYRSLLIPLLLILPPAGLAVDKEIIQLQRDLARLDANVRALQRSIDERMGGLKALLQQTLDRVNEMHTANAVMQASFKEGLSKQERSVGPPMAALGAKMDQMVSELLAGREATADLSGRLRRLEQKLVDVESAVRTMRAPPPPSFSEALGGPPAGVTAQSLFDAAMRDQVGGNYDLALKEFQDYLRYFGNTELAIASQFHIGEIAFYQGDFESALNAFDLLLEQYPKSGKAPDALYMKARVLEKEGKRSQAVDALNKLVRAYPNSDPANRAKSELKRLRAARGASASRPRK
ncbi:MAG: tetratricopeptide repeat protein [Acidobacteria bacterium]|nr:tetratricopeptide repeat protein [Acidobacteriota bacterium]